MIATKLEIKKKITIQIARYTFGNITEDKNSPQLLQLFCCHSDIKTTMNYQQHWLNQEKLDEAISKVIDF